MKNKNKHESAQLAQAVIKKHMNTNLNTKMSNNFQETAEKTQFTFYSVSLRSKLDFFPMEILWSKCLKYNKNVTHLNTQND